VRSAYTRALARAQVVCDAMNAYRAELVSKLGRV
jgi:hypothetical protein